MQIVYLQQYHTIFVVSVWYKSHMFESVSGCLRPLQISFCGGRVLRQCTENCVGWNGVDWVYSAIDMWMHHEVPLKTKSCFVRLARIRRRLVPLFLKAKMLAGRRCIAESWCFICAILKYYIHRRYMILMYIYIYTTWIYTFIYMYLIVYCRSCLFVCTCLYGIFSLISRKGVSLYIYIYI